MLSEKKYEKLAKLLGQDTLTELEALSYEKLDGRIAVAEGAIKQAKDELEANPHYQEAKENIKILSQGLKEVYRRQKAVAEYCLHLREEHDHQ